MNRYARLLAIAGALNFSALALPAAAQLPSAPVLVAPKTSGSVAGQVRPMVAPGPAFAQVEEAGTIARSSANLPEAARRMRQREIPATISLAALRSVFARPDRETAQGMRSASYRDAELLVAFQALDKPVAAALAAKARETGIAADATALHLVKLVPTLDFDALFALIKPGNETDAAFTATVAAKALSAEQIFSTSARYYQSRQLSLGSSRFYPEPEEVVEIVRFRHPGTLLTEIWSRLLLTGYEPSLVWRQVPIGEVTAAGLARDAVGSCLVQNFTDPAASRPVAVERVVPITIAMDGSGSADRGKADCYARFLQAMRERAVSRTLAAQVLSGAVTCVPSQAPTCDALRLSTVNSILQNAGYPPG